MLQRVKTSQPKLDHISLHSGKQSQQIQLVFQVHFV